MIKYLIYVAIFGLSTFAGIEFANTYTKKVAFYEDVVDFCKTLKNEIVFMKTDLLTIFSIKNYKSQLNLMLEALKNAYLEKSEVKNDDICHIFESFDILNANDKKMLSGLFFDLGKLPYDEQLKQIDLYTEKFLEVLAGQRSKAEKMSPFCKKMGILAGLTICIVLF